MAERSLARISTSAFCESASVSSALPKPVRSSASFAAKPSPSSDCRSTTARVSAECTASIPRR
ncbi:hypothetical protein N826_28600 [Skermanella aerolata KACC 11604]|nr:hypothetical protein N826_28600 [Skermanella aerolata KACC 11604]